MARPGLTRHRKFLRLARNIGGELIAYGALGLLWESAYEAGDDFVGDSDDVESCSRWTGERGRLCAAMLDAGFLDQTDAGYAVHDLWHHAPDYVQKRRRREAERRKKVDPVRSVSGQCPVNGEQLPVGQPVVALPPSTQHPAPIKEKTLSSPDGDAGMSVRDALALWNDAAESSGLPTVRTASPGRARKWKQRARDPEFVSGFADAVRELCASSFARSGNWASFDWLLSNDTNWRKAAEGNYRDKNAPQGRTARQEAIPEPPDDVSIARDLSPLMRSELIARAREALTVAEANEDGEGVAFFREKLAALEAAEKATA